MRQPIAVIRLAPGQVGFFDPASRIHLTTASPQTTVYNNMPLACIRHNVKAKMLLLVSGSLEPMPIKDEAKEEPVAEIKAETTPVADKHEITLVITQVSDLQFSPLEEIELEEVTVEEIITEETATEETPAEQALPAATGKKGRRKSR